ncbi:phage/plasmid primase, P4 family [Paradonghicola geojensis]|nr:phage/plasmid primase, P4 family [Marivivens geojensis]
MSTGQTGFSDLENAEALETHIGVANLLKGPQGVYRFDGSVFCRMSSPELRAVALQVLSGREKRVQAARLTGMVTVFESLNYDPELQFELGDPNILALEDGYYEPTLFGWNRAKPNRALQRRIKIPAKYVDSVPVAFEQFLADVLCDEQGEPYPDAARIKTLIYQMLGYILVSHARFEKLFFLVGPGANGKSVLCKVAKAMVGSSNCSAVQLDQLNNTFQRSHLDGKLLNLITELDQQAQIDDGALKAVVSGEVMTVEEKFQSPREIEPFATLLVATNHMPRLRDFSDGVYRRAIVIPLRRQFLGAEADPTLLERLVGELDAITSRAMDALLGLIQNRGQFSTSPTTDAALQTWRHDNDQIARFREENLIDDLGKSATQAQAYTRYQVWRQRSGIKGEIGERQFGTRLEAVGVRRARRAEGQILLDVSLAEC